MVDIAGDRLIIPINENIRYIWEAVEESLIVKHDDRHVMWFRTWLLTTIRLMLASSVILNPDLANKE